MNDGCRVLETGLDYNTLQGRSHEGSGCPHGFHERLEGQTLPYV